MRITTGSLISGSGSSYNPSDVVGVVSLPGTILRSLSSITPMGYLRCNGGLISKELYPELYLTIGDEYTYLPYERYTGQPWAQQYSLKTSSTEPIEWTTEALLPISVKNSHVFVTNKRIFLAGGLDILSRPLATVYSAVINDDGTFGTWHSTGDLPYALSKGSVLITSKSIYIIGGYRSTSSKSILVSDINQDGSIGAWRIEGMLPEFISSAQLTTVGNRVYLLGGIIEEDDPSDQIYVSEISPEGVLGTWSYYGKLPEELDNSHIVNTGTRLHMVCGTKEGSYIRDTYSCDINTYGALGKWKKGDKLPSNVAYGMTLVTTDKVFIFGGKRSNSNSLNTVSATVIDSDGNLGDWVEVGTLPMSLSNGHVVSLRTGVYLLGGDAATGASSIVLKSPFSYSHSYYTNALNNTTVFSLPDFSKEESIGYLYVKT